MEQASVQSAHGDQHQRLIGIGGIAFGVQQRVEIQFQIADVFRERDFAREHSGRVADVVSSAAVQDVGFAAAGQSFSAAEVQAEVATVQRIGRASRRTMPQSVSRSQAITGVHGLIVDHEAIERSFKARVKQNTGLSPRSRRPGTARDQQVVGGDRDRWSRWWRRRNLADQQIVEARRRAHDIARTDDRRGSADAGEDHIRRRRHVNHGINAPVRPAVHHVNPFARKQRPALSQKWVGVNHHDDVTQAVAVEIARGDGRPRAE